MKENNHSYERGISTIEFLIGFPLFLLSTLLVLEIAYMNADSHMVELALFDASRVLSSEQYDENPCSVDALSAAREAITRRMAATSNSVAQVGTLLNLPELGSKYLELVNTGSFSKVVDTNLKRLPMSEVSNRIQCSYDQRTDTLTLEMDYYRQPKFPIVGKTLFKIFSMAEFIENGDEIQGMIKYLEELNQTPTLNSKNLLLPYTVLDTPEKFENVEIEYGNIVNEWKVKTAEILEKLKSEIDTSATEEEQLEYLVSNIPDPYKKIPINSSIVMKRSLNAVNSILGEAGMERPNWHGEIEGLINIQGEFKTWANDLSIEKNSDLDDGVRL